MKLIIALLVGFAIGFVSAIITMILIEDHDKRE